MYRNPTFDYERHQADMAILISDVRRYMGIGITIVAVFAVILALSGRIEAGLNLMMIVGTPLIMIAGIGKALSLWSRRGEQCDDVRVRTIFDQLAEFDDEHPRGHRPRTR